jgi:hypothetical protein
MNVSQDRKARRERLLVREFLTHESLAFRRQGMRSVRKSPGPDVKVTCQIAGEPVRIGIEVVEYQADAKPNGGSVGRRIAELHKEIGRRLRPRLAADKNIRECEGTMCFDWACPLDYPNVRSASAAIEDIVDELVRFLTAHQRVIPQTGSYCFRRSGRRPRDQGDFDQYRLLKKHFTCLRVRRPNNLAGPFSWQYNNAAYIGVVDKNVVSLISTKAAKLLKYDRSGTAQTWLLICAGVSIPHDSAGASALAGSALQSRQVCDAADGSGFHKVAFWERRCGWSAWLTGTSSNRTRT